MNDKPKIVQAMIAMPERTTVAERIRHMDADVRETMLKARQAVENHAQRFSVTGWVPDADAEYAIPEQSRTVIARLRLTR